VRSRWTRRLALLAAVPAALLAALPAGAARAQQAQQAQQAYALPPTSAQCRADSGGDCLDPRRLLAAYGVDRLHARGVTGAGQSICVLDSFGSPTISADVDTFSRVARLPRADLRVFAPAGRVAPYDGSPDRAGWAAETSLDVEWAHAVAPRARIVLLVTPTAETEGIAGFPEMARALRFAVDHDLCDVVSMSFGAAEPTFAAPAQVLALRQAMLVPAARRGVTLVASSGDTGATDYRLDGRSLYGTPVGSWPSGDPLVTSVGGTLLRLDAAGRRTARDSAWGGRAGSGAGGGALSALFGRPAFQDGVRSVVGSRRGTPDVAMVAAPESGLVTVESFQGGSRWRVEAGTSAAAPVFAGMVALADQVAGRRAGWLDPLLYGPLRTPGAGLVDVRAGRNDLVSGDGRAPTVRGAAAGPGFDLATGLGTLDAARFVPALAHQVRMRR